MSFHSEDVPLDYQVFTGAVAYLLKRIEADPAGGITDFESPFKQRGHPSHRDIVRHAEWLLKMTQRCCFSVTSFLGALIYIERLCRQGKLSLYESTWRSTWVAMSVLSEKRWEDNYVHPGHIHATYASKHTTDEQLKMQLALFKALDFNMKIEYNEFTGWLNKLREEDRDQKIMAACHFQRVFIPRPIPNLKVKMPSTPSTSAGNSESEDLSLYPSTSAGKSEWRQQRQPIGYGHHHLTTSSYTLTPRGTGEGNQISPYKTHTRQHGGAITTRDYQGSRDWAPQHAPQLRSGGCAQDFPAPRPQTDFYQLDLRLTELRMQEINHKLAQHNADLHRTSGWNNAEQKQHQQATYQHRHRIAAPRHSAMGTSMTGSYGTSPTKSIGTSFDHGNQISPQKSWTTRAPQVDLHRPRSGVVAWS